jgi:branched-chain amino acid transport system permease protein
MSAVQTAIARLRSERDRLLVPVGLITVLVVSVQLMPRGMPGGLYGTALVQAAFLALGAVGVLLVFRSDRIINFAQVQLGALGGVVFFECVRRLQFARWLHSVCPPCVDVEKVGRTAIVHASLLLQWINFVLSLMLALGSAAAVGLLVRVVIIRRFRGQSPIIGTVATIGVVQVLGFLTQQVPTWFSTIEERRRGIASFLSGTTSARASAPADVTFTIAPQTFHLAEIATVVVTALVLAGLMVFLRRARLGVAVRAVAENGERAATLGMDGERLAGRVWIIAGLLSGVAAVLVAMTNGVQAIGGVSSSGLLRILAAVVIAGMSSIPLAITVAVGLAVFDIGFQWSYADAGNLIDAIVFGVLVLVLLIRRARVRGRLDPEAAGWRAAEEAHPVPVQLRDLAVVRRARRWGPVALAVLLLAFPWVMSPNDTHQGTVMLFYAMIGLSLLVLTGWAGQISLGQFAFAAVGGYVTAVVGGTWGWPLPIAVAFGALAGGLLSVIVGLPALRIRGLYLGVTTLGFAVVTLSVLLAPRFGGRALPASLKRPVVLGLDTGDERIWYYIALAVLIAFVVAVAGMRRSRTARALIASRDNERAAQALGISLVRARLEAFAVAGFLAAFAGALFAYHQEGVHAGNYTIQASLNMFLLAVIGGLGSIAGPLLGALYVGALAIFAPSFADLGTGVAALAVLLFAPAGLTRIAFSLRDLVLWRIAERHRVIVPGMAIEGARSTYRVPIAPKLLPSGATATVPVRYRSSFYRPKVDVAATRRERRG